jgi:hypothetical protein
MQIELLATISGTRNGVDWPERGSVIELPVDEAENMIANKLAKPVEAADDTVVEAVVEAPKKAVRR